MTHKAYDELPDPVLMGGKGYGEAGPEGHLIEMSEDNVRNAIDNMMEQNRSDQRLVAQLHDIKGKIGHGQGKFTANQAFEQAQELLRTASTQESE